MVATTATILHHHRIDHFPQDGAIAPLILHAHVLPCLLRLPREFHAHFIENLQRAHGHADGLAHIVDEYRMHALVEEPHAFVEIGAKGTRGEKA